MADLGSIRCAFANRIVGTAQSDRVTRHVRAAQPSCVGKILSSRSRKLLADRSRDRYRDRVGKTIKVCLTNGGEDRETPWAHDLGPVPGRKGSRKVRLVNVPFLHAKPTWGDVIVVTPRRGALTWDRASAPILVDGGRWAMILEYAPEDVADGEDEEDPCFDALAQACAELEVVCEGSFSPKGRPRGRAYLAVKQGTTDKAVMNHLVRAELACQITQLFPEPAKAVKRTKKSARLAVPIKRVARR